MIVDIYNEVFTKLKTEIPTANILPEYPIGAPIFPCIIVEEKSNNSLLNTVDTSGENHNVLSFEINIFSNAENKRSVCRELRIKVDSIMSDLYGMNRTNSMPVPNYSDLNIYRYMLTYGCTIDKNKKIYRG